MAHQTLLFTCRIDHEAATGVRFARGLAYGILLGFSFWAVVAFTIAAY